MTRLETLTASRDARQVEYDALAARPTYSADGRAWQHDQHRKALLDEIDKLNNMIIRETGAVESRTLALG